MRTLRRAVFAVVSAIDFTLFSHVHLRTLASDSCAMSPTGQAAMSHEFFRRSLAPTPARIAHGERRQRHDHLRARHHPDRRLRRRGGRLQPRQLGQGCDAGGGGCHRADAVEGGGQPERKRDSDQGQRLLQSPVQPAGSTGCASHHRLFEWQLAGACERNRACEDQFHGHVWASHISPSARSLW